MKKLTTLLALVMALALALPSDGDAAPLSEVKKLLASDAEPRDAFGFSVAVSGDTAVVGAAGEDAGATDAGAAYIFQRDEGGTDNWGELKKLTASDAQDSSGFGAVAVSGDTAVVGANNENAGGIAAGAAYVFGRDQGGSDNWGEVKKLTASDRQPAALFGSSVALSGDTAVAGAPSIQTGTRKPGPGAAYVFQRDEGGAGNWGEVAKLTASDAQVNDVFGISVAVSGETAIVGASVEDAAGSNAGAAYVFGQPVPTPTNTPTPTPTQTATPVPPTPAGGAAVSLPQTGAASDGSRGAAAHTWLAVGAVAGALALGGAAWFVRRRLLR